MDAQPQYLETDLVVVGGGVAGCMAALAACEAGLQVIICEKGRLLERSGSIGGGVDHYLTVMESGPEWDTPEFLLRHIPELTDGIVDMAVTERVVREMPRILRKLESLGVDFKDPRTGTYDRHRSFGLPGTYHINFDGSRFKQYIGQAVRRGGAQVLTRVMVTDVLVRDGRAYGAVCFHFRTGEWYLVRGRAVVLSTGDINRIAKNASSLPFDSWHCPYNTGDAQAMGYRAGAALTNMEFVEATLTPKGFSTQGLNAIISLGAHLLNRHGDRFMFKYDPKGENARRAVLADAVINEVLEGNGPIYMDLRHLPAEVLDHLEATLRVDRHTLPAFYRQKRVNFREQPVEISVSELSIRRSGLYFRGSGLVVDENGETNITGLFAAGDCASVSGGISGAATLGYIAGRGAVARIQTTTRSLPEVPWEDLAAIRERVFAHLHQQSGLRFRAFEDEIRQTVTDYVGFRRTGRGLHKALSILEDLQRREPLLQAVDLHELMRVHEARHIRQNAELMARAALVREESRTGSAHRRLDFPRRDDQRWRKFIILLRGPDGPEARLQDADKPLAAGLRS